MTKKVLLLGGLIADTDVGEYMAGVTERMTNLCKAERMDVEIVWAHFDALTYVVDGPSTVIYDTSRKVPLTDYDLVLFRGKVHAYAHYAALISAYLTRHSVKFAPHIYGEQKPVGKLGQTMAFTELGLSAPKTLSGNINDVLIRIDDFLGYPVVVKADLGSKGRDNHLAHNRDEVANLLRNSSFAYVVQEFIPNKCDYRVTFFGSSSAIVRRSRQDANTHLNNISQGATSELVPAEFFPKRLHDAFAAIIQHFSLEIIGIDVIYDPETDKEYFLEVNKRPQVDMTDTPVFYTDQLIVSFLKSELQV